MAQVDIEEFSKLVKQPGMVPLGAGNHLFCPAGKLGLLGGK